MPRKPRLDVPGLIYHVMGRGIERKEIFLSDADRYDFLDRLGTLLTDTATPIYAFVLMPNHFHLLIKRGAKPVSTLLQRLLTGYAVKFNKKHKRSGHLFQNRYKSFICQEDPYFLELIRYIHLNPIRADLLGDTNKFNRWPFSGHAHILGKRHSDWFDTDIVLSHFASTEKKARNLYSKFVIDGMDEEVDFSGGGLKRSLEDSSSKRQAFDDRILGDGQFVEKIIATESKVAHRDQDKLTQSIISSVVKNRGVSKAQLLGRSRERKLASFRAELAYRLSTEAGLSGRDIGVQLGVSDSGISRMLANVEKAKETGY